MHALESMCKRMSMRKKITMKRHRQRQRPPAPAPAPGEHVDGLLICVQLKTDVNNAVFMRIRIPYEEINPLLVMNTKQRLKGPSLLILHQHDSQQHDSQRFRQLTPDANFNGPFVSTASCLFPSCAVGSLVFSFTGNCRSSFPVPVPNCHTIQFCDFTHPQPLWKPYLTLPSHRVCPTLVPLGEQVYVFEQRAVIEPKDDPSNRSPLGFVLDVCNRSCNVLQLPAFEKENLFYLMVAPLERKLMVLDKWTGNQYFVDTESWNWIPFEVDGLVDHMSCMEGQCVVVVSETNTIYWLDQEANIRAFDGESLRIFVGPIIGFGHDNISLRDYFLSLVHVKEDFFCLVWSHRSSESRSMDLASKLHLTLISVSFHAHSPSPHNLTAYVVGCWCYNLDFNATVQAAHLLREDLAGSSSFNEPSRDETDEPYVSFIDEELGGTGGSNN